MSLTWTTEPLGDLCAISIGRTPARAEARYWRDGVLPWLSIADMSQGVDLIRSKERITDAAAAECGCRVVAAGTLVMSFKLSVGKLGFVRVPMYTNEAIAALPVRDSKKLDSRFLYRALQVSRLGDGADRAVMGLTLNSDKLAKIPISYPRDLRDQRWIADVLDRADAVRRKRGEALALSEALLRSSFLELIGDPLTNPKGWPVKPLAALGRITTGNTPSRAVDAYFGAEIEWIKSDNINTRSHFLTRSTEGLSSLGREVGRVVPAGSSLVTCIAGSPDCIGNVALADREVAFNQQINAVSPFEGVDHRFVYVLLLVGKRLVQAASTNGMKGMVSKGRLEEVRVPLPPAPLRAKFGEVFDRVLRLSHDQERAQREAERLFQSTVQVAFSGQLKSREVAC